MLMQTSLPSSPPLESCLSRRLGDGEIFLLRVVSGVKEASMSTLAVRGCGMGHAGEELGAGRSGRSWLRCECPPSSQNQTLEGSAALTRLPKGPSCVPAREPGLGSPPFSRHAWPETIKAEKITQKPAM